MPGARLCLVLTDLKNRRLAAVRRKRSGCDGRAGRGLQGSAGRRRLTRREEETGALGSASCFERRTRARARSRARGRSVVRLDKAGDAARTRSSFRPPRSIRTFLPTRRVIGRDKMDRPRLGADDCDLRQVLFDVRVGVAWRDERAGRQASGRRGQGDAVRSQPDADQSSSAVRLFEEG